MLSFRFTAVHVRRLLGLNRTELQRWMSALPPFCDAPTQERTARQFSIRDLVFFVTLHEMSERLQLPARALAGFSSQLYSFMEGQPVITNRAEVVFLNSEAGQWSVANARAGDLSVALEMTLVWERVYRFIGLEEEDPQQGLPLGLVAIGAVDASKVRRG